MRAGTGSRSCSAPHGPSAPPAAATNCLREQSSALPAWEGGEGANSGKLSVLCAGFLCARRHQCARGIRSSSRHQCSQGGHLGGCWPKAPRPTKPHEIHKPWAGQGPAAASLSGWAVGPRAPLSSSCCLTQRAASGLNVTSRRSGRGRAGAGHRPRFGWAGQLAQAPSLSPHPWQRQQR